MNLKSIIKESCYSTIATVSKDSLNKLKLFSQYNLSLIRNFETVILCTNKAEDVSDEIVDQYHEAWRSLLPDIDIIHLSENKGHMFGTVDLEENILSRLKTGYPNVKYLWKSMDDVINSYELLNLEVEEADFYYLPGFSYESIMKAGSKDALYKTFENYESGFWTPQTTFFILNISNIDTLYGNDVRYKSGLYQEEKARNPFINPWDMPFDIKFACEDHLGRTTKDLKKHCLLNKDNFEKLLDLVEYNKIGDPSHKNIYFDTLGICHYHYYKDLIYNA